jgi:hypothetical protein
VPLCSQRASSARSCGEGAETEFGLAVIGFIICFVGAIRSNRFDLSWFVAELSGSDTEWQQVFVPTTWAPRSVDQLRAVEQLADEHGGKAGTPAPGWRDRGEDAQARTSPRARATMSLAAGVSLFSLARRMGTSVQMIDRTYGHLAPDAEEYERGLLDSYDARAMETEAVEKL